MNFLKRLFVFGIVLILGLTAYTLNTCGQQVQTFIKKPDSLQVGDTLTYSLKIQQNQDYDKVILPDSSDFGKSIEIKDRKFYRISSNTDSVVYSLQFFGTEDVMLKDLAIQFIAGNDTTTKTVPRELLKFASALDGEEFKPLKPIFEFAAEYWPYILALILLLIAAYLIYRYMQARKEQPEKSIKPKPRKEFQDPLEQLLHTIQTLRNNGHFKTHEQIKDFYIQLGDALRLYYERLYDIPALESTSNEFIRDLEAQYVDPDQINKIKELMREADMVKFAKFIPPPDHFDRALDKAEHIAEQADKEDRARIERLKNIFEENEKNEEVEQSNEVVETDTQSEESNEGEEKNKNMEDA